MAAFLLFVFVFASMVIGGFNRKLPPPSHGKTISILNIDGGGIKGILPTIILDNLEKALQEKDEKATLATYFDVITGASTGGLIAIMLAAPNPNDPSRPAFSTSEILSFYLEFGPSIFNQTSKWDVLTQHSKYDGKFLHDKTREILPEARLNDTLTKLVIPTFDIKKVHPVIFSSFKVNKFPSLNAKLSDIALGTSAAPTYLPAYNFTNGDSEFNLVDAALASASPALFAVNEVIQQLEEENSDFIYVKENESTKILLLSLGTGRYGESQGVDAEDTKKFRAAVEWPPVVIGGLSGSAGDLNEVYLRSIFPSQSSENYYLRIEEYNLDPTMTSDNATKESMDNLKKAGKDLLEQIVKGVDINSFGPYEKPIEGTNAQALKRLAETLYNEKQLRLKTKLMEKTGRPFLSGMK